MRYRKLIRKPSIWAIIELQGINKSRDTTVWIFWKILGYEKNFIFWHFWYWKWHPTPNLMILPERSGIFPISLGGCEPFFGKISPRNGEKSTFSKKIFWTISQQHIAYVLSWDITYLCAKFQRQTFNSLYPNMRQFAGGIRR